MKASTLITGVASIAIILAAAAFIVVFRYSTTRHLSKDFKAAPAYVYQPGDAVILKPGKIFGIILDADTNWVSVCVPDASGGIKTQLVSPLILERYSRW